MSPRDPPAALFRSFLNHFCILNGFHSGLNGVKGLVVLVRVVAVIYTCGSKRSRSARNRFRVPTLGSIVAETDLERINDTLISRANLNLTILKPRVELKSLERARI